MRPYGKHRPKDGEEIDMKKDSPEEIMDKVKELGIDYSQGFYIDKPSIDISTEF